MCGRRVPQTADELIPKVLLVWLGEHELIKLARSEPDDPQPKGYFQSARTQIATSLWNLAKKPENSLKLATPLHFDSLLERLDDKHEQDSVVRRVLSAVQLIAGNQQCLHSIVAIALTGAHGFDANTRGLVAADPTHSFSFFLLPYN